MNRDADRAGSGPGSGGARNVGTARLVKTAAALAVSMGLLWWAFRGVSAQQMRSVFASAHAGWLVIAYAVVLAACVVHCCRWSMLLNLLGGKYRFSHLVRVHFVGMLCNLVLPAQLGVDAARIQFARTLSVRRSQMLAVVLVDRLLGVLAVSSLGLVTWMLFYRDGMPGWIVAIPAALFCGSITLVIVLTWLNQPLLCRWAGRIPVPGLKTTLIGIIEQTRWQRIRLRTAASIGMAATIQCILMAVALGTIGHALDLPGRAFVIGAALPLIATVTMIPISINSLGVREAMFRVTLTSAGLSDAQAMTVAAVWLAMVILSAVPGLYGLMSVSDSNASGPPMQPDAGAQPGHSVDHDTTL